MRRGAEEEEWDRLAFLLTNMAAMHGVKNTKMEQFHKFKMPDQGLTKKRLHDMKAMFKNATVRR